MDTRRNKVGVLSLLVSAILIFAGISVFFANMNNESDAQQSSDGIVKTLSVQEKITGTGDKMIKGGDFCNFLSDVGITPSRDNWGDGIEYQIIVTGVDSEEGCSYSFAEGDKGFTPSKNDDGKTYTVHYQLQKNENGAGWQDCAGVTATKNLTVYAVNEVKQEVGNDETYIKSLSMYSCSDGTSPWDVDDNPGDDSNDANGIIRSYDTATYNIAYTTASYELGTSYKDAYINFTFILPLEEKYGTFDTDEMSWMSTDTAHMWNKTIATDENGKTYQVLNCSKKIISTDATTAVPGSGEVYLTLRVYLAPNGTKIAPIARAYMDGNKTGENLVKESSILSNRNFIGTDYDACGTHNSKEITECELTELTVSAAPRYNVFLARGTYMAELGGTFDFSTGNSDAPNKSAGKVNGRLVKYSVGMELRNEVISSGPDKGKSKYMRGIEIPEGNITYNVDLSTVYAMDSGQKVDLSTQSEYTPLLWGMSGNGSPRNDIYGRSLDSISTTDTSRPYDYHKRTVAKDGLQNPITKDSAGNIWGTGYCWNGGDRTATQLGNRISITASNYDINPIWFPNCGAWTNTSIATYYDPAQGVMRADRGIFNVTELYVVVPYGNNDNYLPTKYGGSGTIQVNMRDNSLRATSISGQSLALVDDTSNQSSSEDDYLTDTVWLSRSGSFNNYIWYSPAEKPASWSGSCGVDDSYCQTHGSDTVMLGQDIGTYWGIIRDASGEYANTMQAADVLLKFDDEAFTIKTVNKVGITKRILYATKKDGTSWLDDNEMNNTKIEDLVYYDSLEEATSNNKKCVGIMAELRQDPSQAKPIRSDVFASSVLTATKNREMAGHVAQIVIESNAWNAQNNGDMLPVTPSRLDVQNGDATEDDYEKNRFVKNRKANYVKTEYDANGTAIFHTGGITIGDSALITSYISKISISTAQENDNGTVKDIYNLDNNQYSVDYVLSPTIDAGTNTLNGSTTVTIKTVLPFCLEYTPGSSNFGGTYEKSEKSGYKGTITGGQEIDPSVTKDKDGNTTLTWIIENVKLENRLPSLYFNAQIDATTDRNVDFNTTASINTTEDQRVIRAQHGNYSNYTIKTAKTSDISIQTKAEKPVNDAEKDLVYVTNWSNNSSVSLNDQVMLSIAPKNGDSAGSKYNGSAKITDIKLLGDAKDNAKTYEIWYTTDEKGYELTTSDDNLPADSIRSGNAGGVVWHKIEIDEHGVAKIPNGADITAWCVLGAIPSKGSVNASVTIDVDGNKSGDRYVNTVWLTNSTTQASCYIVTRMLNGVTWIDANGNNKRDQDEQRLAGVKVSLRDNNNNIIKSLNSTDCVTITDENGEYNFMNLPSGTFHVVFEDGGAGFESYRQSAKNDPSVPDLVDCDADGKYSNDGILTHGITDNIIMPATEDIISTPYVISNIDAGYIPTSSVSLPISGGNGVGLFWLFVAVMPIGAIAFIKGRAHELGRKHSKMRTN